MRQIILHLIAASISLLPLAAAEPLELFVRPSIETQLPEALDDTNFKTINPALARAAELAASGQDVVVRILPGIYHEALQIHPPEEQPEEKPEQPGIIYVAGWEGGEVRIRGTVPLGTLKVDNKFNIFSGEYPFSPEPVRTVLPLPDGMRTHAMVFVEDTRIEAVERINRIGAGRFFHDPTGNRLYLLPPSNSMVTASTVEVANPNHGYLLHVKDMANVKWYNIIFERSTFAGDETGYNPGVLVENSRNVVFENCTIQHCQTTGALFKDSSSIGLYNSASVRNGISGLIFENCRNIVMTGHDNSLNGSLFFYQDPLPPAEQPPSVLVQDSHGIDLNNLRLTENHAGGLVLRNVTGPINIQRLSALANRGRAVSLHESAPVNVTGAEIARNFSAGVFTDSALTLENSILFDNGILTNEAQLRIDNFTTTPRIRLHTNMLLSDRAEAPLIEVMAAGNFWTSYDSASCLYFAPSAETAFSIRATPLSFENWQQVTGEDLNAYFGNPLLVDPDAFDFNPAPKSPWFSMSKWPEAAVDSSKQKALRAELSE